MLRRRADATLVRDAPRLRSFLPFISPCCSEALIDLDLEVDTGLTFLEECNRNTPRGKRATLFHLFLRAIEIS